MASNTKYTRASQRDSLDDPAHYSQAPPSYAEPSTSADNEALLGGPRSSEDNIPDDFKVHRRYTICDFIIYNSDNGVVWGFGS